MALDTIELELGGRKLLTVVSWSISPEGRYAVQLHHVSGTLDDKATAAPAALAEALRDIATWLEIHALPEASGEGR